MLETYPIEESHTATTSSYWFHVDDDYLTTNHEAVERTIKKMRLEEKMHRIKTGKTLKEKKEDEHCVGFDCTLYSLDVTYND